MPSKTSWFNKQLIVQTIRSAGWISLVYFLGLLFALPLDVLRQYTDYKKALFRPEPVEYLFHYGINVQLPLLIVVPVLMAIFLFRFLQLKQAAEMLHSLPIKREKIYFHYTISGMVALLVPVLLIALIMLIMYAVIDLSPFFQLKDIFIWARTTILLNFVIFNAGVFVAMMTGMSVVQGILTYIFLLFPGGITFLLTTNLNYLLFGFPGSYYLAKTADSLSPLVIITMVDERGLQWNEVLIYGAATLILYGLSLYFYKRRKVESASEAIAFPKLRSIFKYGVTFCVMLLGGAYFGSRETIGWLIFGYIVGAVIGYYIAEMVLKKTWKVFRNVKGLLIFGLGTTLVMLGIQAFGLYERKIPDQEQIEEVIFTNSPYAFIDRQSYYGTDFVPDALREEDNKKAVRALHQQIVKNKDHLQTVNNQYAETVFFYYQLKNGGKQIRQYNVDREQFEKYYKQFQETEEYKRASNEIFHLDAADVDYLLISVHSPIPRNATIRNEDEIQEFMNIYREDVLAESYEDSVYYQDYGISVELFMDQEHITYLTLKPTYKGSARWLEERGMLEKTRFMPTDVDSIQIVEEKGYTEMGTDEIAAAIEKRSDVLEIKDEEQIGAMLTSSTGWLRKYRYIAVVHYGGSDQYNVVYMDERHAPEFVKKHFQK